ncbi:hypothetical protein [Candidatus Methanoliparum sp. LAM-1]|uniref:hypothetical protein n=1 Tax=Candidatus Methanoliparum sp. LAM-1 TaxID=2874846 RepID=UPI001E3D0869|nr:hypothetical protein [Candidatus Methanoliparum sp. LAM-1]BDC36573.1 hypothetical protein MTLP_12550 [Candidatus Methanoliparum sp. LAM-1]
MNIRKIRRMWKDEEACNLILCSEPIAWMSCGALLEWATGCIFGTCGKLCLLCFPS